MVSRPDDAHGSSIDTAFEVDPALDQIRGRDVLIVGDGDLVEASIPLARRLRENGYSVNEDHSFASWCAAADALDELLKETAPRAVILSFRSEGGCGDGVQRSVITVGSDRRAVLVIQPGPGRQDDRAYSEIVRLATAENILTADPSQLLGGEAMPTSLGCQWWDDCAADGTVEIRDPSGQLTAAGGERVARVIVGVVG